MPNPVAYFELGGRDASGLKEFYSSLFDWKIESSTPAAAGGDYFHIHPTEGGIAGGILQTTGDMPPSYVMFYVSVDELQPYLDKAESLGGKTVVSPMPIPGDMGHIAVFIDPDGKRHRAAQVPGRPRCLISMRASRSRLPPSFVI